MTFDDPEVAANMGYGYGFFAPGVADSGVNDYIVSTNIIKAHAAAYKSYKANYTGQLGISLTGNWMEPMDEFSPEDWYASDRAMQFSLGWFASPIFGSGDYPQVMKDIIGDRLPVFSDEEMADIKGNATLTLRYHFVNHYCITAIISKPYNSFPCFVRN